MFFNDFISVDDIDCIEKSSDEYGNSSPPASNVQSFAVNAFIALMYCDAY